MSGPPPKFEIHETRAGTGFRLSVTGELDMATAPILEERLAPLRDAQSPVRLDLSKLEFIDSTGLHLLVRMVGDARKTRWRLQIEPDVAPVVMQLLKMTDLERRVLGDDG